MRPLDLPTRALFLLAGLVLLAPPAVAAGWTPIVPAVRIDTGGGDSRGLPAVVMDESGESVVAWLVFTFPGTFADFSLVARRLSAAGVPAGGAFPFDLPCPDGNAGAGPMRPALAADRQGGYLVVWSSETTGTDQQGRSIQLLRLAADGAPEGDAVQVNDGVAGDQQRPAIAVAPDGRFVVAWDSTASGGDDADGCSIQARLFAADGEPQGGDFQVNDGTQGHQQEPAVAWVGNETFAIVWTSASSTGDDADGTSVQARLFADTGAPAGPSRQINVATTGDQRVAAIASDGAGSVVLAWQDVGGNQIDAALYAVPEPSRAAQALAAFGVLAALHGRRGGRIPERRESLEP